MFYRAKFNRQLKKLGLQDLVHEELVTQASLQAELERISSIEGVAHFLVGLGEAGDHRRSMISGCHCLQESDIDQLFSNARKVINKWKVDGDLGTMLASKAYRALEVIKREVVSISSQDRRHPPPKEEGQREVSTVGAPSASILALAKSIIRLVPERERQTTPYSSTYGDNIFNFLRAFNVSSAKVALVEGLTKKISPYACFNGRGGNLSNSVTQICSVLRSSQMSELIGQAGGRIEGPFVFTALIDKQHIEEACERDQTDGKGIIPVDPDKMPRRFATRILSARTGQYVWEYFDNLEDPREVVEIYTRHVPRTEKDFDMDRLIVHLLFLRDSYDDAIEALLQGHLDT